MNTNYFFFAALLILGVGCNKIDSLTQFELQYEESVVIPASSVLNLPFNLFTPEMTTNSESTFEVNNTNKDLIEEILLTKLKMEISSPSDADFRFLESVQVFINADGLAELEIASLNPVPNNVGPLIELETAGNDLKEYIKKDEFSLRVNTVTDELLDEDYEIKVTSDFFVDAKILGQ